MKIAKKIFGFLMLTVIMVSFSQCSSAQKLQKKPPTVFGEIYFQNWVAGVEGGGSGINLFIETLNDDIVLDSVYFRGQSAKFEVKPANKLLYIGRFVSEFNKKEDMVVSSDLNQEYVNKAPEISNKNPFKLKEDECVVSYFEEGTVKYFKLENIKERQSLDIPMTPKQNNN